MTDEKKDGYLTAEEIANIRGQINIAKHTPSSFRTVQLSDVRHKFKVYLAGPITGLSYKGCTDWREYAIGKFPPEIAGYSPMRHKSFLRDVEKLTGTYDDWPLGSQRGIFARDFYDCKTSDVILINLLNSEIVSIGTVMEIAWGSAFQIPVVLVKEKEGNIHEHAMLREACPFVVSDLDEGIHVVSTILLPSSH